MLITDRTENADIVIGDSMGLFDLFRKKKPENTEQDSNKKAAADRIVLSGVMHTIDDEMGYAYEIDDTFRQTKSHAAEVETLAVYAFGKEDWTEADQPSVFVLTDDRILDAIEEYKEKGTVSDMLQYEAADGMFLFRAVMEYYGDRICYYAFEMEREEDEWQLGLCMMYPAAYENTENEAILKRVLDEAAKTFRVYDE